MHALVGAAHVDHLHPDAVIALAAAADGEALTKECFGREVAGCRGAARASSWVARWRRWPPTTRACGAWSSAATG